MLGAVQGTLLTHATLHGAQHAGVVLARLAALRLFKQRPASVHNSGTPSACHISVNGSSRCALRRKGVSVAYAPMRLALRSLMHARAVAAACVRVLRCRMYLPNWWCATFLPGTPLAFDLPSKDSQ